MIGQERKYLFFSIFDVDVTVTWRLILHILQPTGENPGQQHAGSALKSLLGRHAKSAGASLSWFVIVAVYLVARITHQPERLM